MLFSKFSRTAECLYGESSMRNGFGLRLLHKFLGLPFLRLQKDTLLSLIQRNERDSEVCSFELSEFLVKQKFFFIFIYCNMFSFLNHRNQTMLITTNS